MTGGRVVGSVGNNGNGLSHGGARLRIVAGGEKKTQLEAASPREERLASAASEENFELQSAAVQGGKWALDGDNGRSIFGDGPTASSRRTLIGRHLLPVLLFFEISQ